MGRCKALIGPLILTALLGILYLPVLKQLVALWMTDMSNMGYGFFIPPVAAYLVWERRHDLHIAPGEHAWGGYLLVLIGLALLFLGRAGDLNVVAEGSLIIVLFGIVLFLGGPKLTGQVAFPLCFLAFMIPPPSSVYYWVTWPLQLFTARFSTDTLHLFGYPALLHGVYIDLPHVRLQVAAACSGFRSLMSLGAAGVLLAYATRSGWADRALLIASVLPIAILSNTVRVAVNILLGTYAGTYHTITGWMLFVLATACLLGMGALLPGRGRAGTPA
jgi:exosortase